VLSSSTADGNVVGPEGVVGRDTVPWLPGV